MSESSVRRGRRRNMPQGALTAYERRVRARALEDFFYFARHVLGFKDLTEGLHRPLCDFISGGGRHKLMALFRGAFKSTLGSIAYPLWRACRDPDITILLASSTPTLARSHIRAIRNHHLLGNDRFRRLFSCVLPPDPSKVRWSDQAVEVRRRPGCTKTAATFEAASRRSQVTGRKFDLIIEDDLLAPEEDAFGNERMEVDPTDVLKAVNWHVESYNLYHNPSAGEHVVITTRWAYHDHFQWIMDREVKDKGGTYQLMVVPLLDEKGKSVFPERYPDQTVAQLRHRSSPYFFSTQYLLDPMADEDRVYRESDLQWYEPSECPPVEELSVYAAVDPAISQASWAHGCAFVVVGVDSDGMRWVLETHDEKISAPEQVQRMFEIHSRYENRLRVFLFEQVAYQEALGQFVRQEMRRRNQWFRVEPVKHTPQGDSKRARIRGMQGYFQNGAVKMSRSQRELERQLLSFPDDTYRDDLIDCLEMVLTWINDQLPHKVPIPSETRQPSFRAPEFSVEEIEALAGTAAGTPAPSWSRRGAREWHALDRPAFGGRLN